MPQNASIVCLSSIDWSFNWQIPQEVALAFAERGNRVLFVENTGVRRAGLRDWGRLWSRLQNWYEARGGFKRVAGSLDLFSPLLLPLPYSHSAISINTRVLVRAVRAWLGDSSGPVILITFLPTPLARAVIDELKPDLVVYHCLDRLAESSPGARRVVDSERRLFAEADLVLVTSGVLYQAAAELNARVELLASGVRVQEFRRARIARAKSHAEFPSGPLPIIGYVGSIRNATDLALLTRVTELADDLQFMLVGPRFVDFTALAARPNVRLLDAVPREDVKEYMVRFKVGLLPYQINEFTAGIMPVKLKEYLAAGLPVVATPLPEVLRFAEQHPGLVMFGRDPSEFVRALRTSLADGAPKAVAHRIAVAQQYDWSCQMERMNELIDQELARTSSAIS